MTPSDLKRLDAQLDALHLAHVKGNYQALATTAAQKQLSHLAYLAELIEGEAARRETRAVERRIKNARFPVLKTMEDFEWTWPKKINRPQIQNLFRLAFIATNTNVVFISTVGLGKTHVSIALGHAACVGGHSVLFTTAVVTAYDYLLSQPGMWSVDVINNSWGNSYAQFDPYNPVAVATRAVGVPRKADVIAALGNVTRPASSGTRAEAE